MFDFSPFTNVTLWYFVILLIVAFPMIYVTKSIFMGLIPMIAFTSWLSLSGYLKLWYLYVMLFMIVTIFVLLYVIPFIVPREGGS